MSREPLERRPVSPAEPLRGAPARGPGPDVEARLAALEASLRQLADEISVTRRQVTGAPSAWASPDPEPAAPLERDRPDGGEHSAAAPRPARRASLRDSPLDVLFRPSGEGNVGCEDRPEDRPPHLAPRSARLLAHRDRLLGPDHPDTLWAAHDLARELARTGETAPARRLASRVLEARTRLLGPDHPFTVRSRDLSAAVGGVVG